MIRLALGLLLAAASACAADDAFDYNRRLGRGVNLGNALDAPTEGAWGVVLNEDYFKAIKRAGFDSVRLPVRWSAHAGARPPYEIEPAFFARVDWAIQQALSNGLRVVLDVHHDDEMSEAPEKYLPRLKALWSQIARRYQDRPEALAFELLNEPTGALDDELWNKMLLEALAVVRESNPKRVVIVGPGRWNNLTELDKLALPEDDRRLVVTFHYYNPFHFTHQQASWAKGSEKWAGTRWTGSPEELARLRAELDRAASWGKAHGRPLYMGEFGAYSKADLESRVRWTRAVAREASARGMSWAYWEFCSGFGVYDPQANAWRMPLLNALLGP